MLRRPPSRAASSLARFVNAPGGITAEQAQERADMKLDFMRERALAEVDESLSGIGAQLAALEGRPAPDVLAEIERQATLIAGLAGTFGLDGMSKAAYSLCQLIDLSEEAGLWDREAVEVHYNALRALRHTHLAEAEGRVLAGLHRIIQRVTTQTA